MDPDEFEALVDDIRVHGLMNPVQLSVEGRLYAGHERLKAMLALGRKRIPADKVEINPRVTRDNELEYCVADNLVRRHLDVAKKADVMWRLTAKGWTQKKIAKVFHITQPAVSMLMRDHPPAGGLPDTRTSVGEDGKARTTVPKPKTDERPDVTARDETPTPYEYRQRVNDRLKKMSLSAAHLDADLQMCGPFPTFEQRDSVITAINGIVYKLLGIAERIRTGEPDEQ
jgi:ParB-like chromosome segregation protein Spo0J